jgi:hypothetical protein
VINEERVFKKEIYPRNGSISDKGVYEELSLPAAV